jgi:outer membrane protein OmpA-like peptidoglycan-associated protein
LKTLFVIITFLFFADNALISQTFNLSDTVFSPNQTYRPQTGKIQFMYYSDSILPLSYQTLDSVADFLLKNPKITIEIGVHSDSRGSDKYSVRFDTPRAKSVKLYLINKGISENRITAKGYWSKSPIITDDEIEKMKTIQEKEEAHFINRRTEFKIIAIDYSE